MEIKGEKKTKVVEYETIDDVVCNKCGKSVQTAWDSCREGTRMCANFDYGSAKDGVIEEFDICDRCYDDFIATFKHKPKEF